MPKLKVLSGYDVVKILARFNFVVDRQKGSHIKLRRTVNGCKQTMTIPNHSELDIGTLRAIYRQATKYIAEFELRDYFMNQ